MENKLNIYRTAYLTIRLKYLLIFLIFPIFQSAYAQEQWRVFTSQNSGLPDNDVHCIAIDTNNVKWIGTSADAGLTKFDGINWTVFDTSNSPLPHNQVQTLKIDKNNNIWIGTFGGGLAKFDGTNWIIFDTLNSAIQSNIITDIIIDEYDIKWLGTGDKGLVKFDNINWISYNTSNSGIPSNGVITLYLEDSVKWIGTFTSGIAKFDNLNWNSYNMYNSGLPSNMTTYIFADALHNKWITTYFGGIAKFNSQLNQWTIYNSTNSGLPNNHTLSVFAVNHVKYIGTLNSGFAVFNDTNWIIYNPQNSPLPGISVGDFCLDSLKNIWIAVSGGLVIFNPNGIIGVNNQIINTPLSFKLYQNYPNPFNPTTNIKYQIVKSSHVKLGIFDILGRKVSVLVNQRQNAGNYTVSFNGENLPSGIYFFRLETENYTETRKMVLMK